MHLTIQEVNMLIISINYFDWFHLELYSIPSNNITINTNVNCFFSVAPKTSQARVQTHSIALTNSCQYSLSCVSILLGNKKIQSKGSIDTTKKLTLSRQLIACNSLTTALTTISSGLWLVKKSDKQSASRYIIAMDCFSAQISC